MRPCPRPYPPGMVPARLRLPDKESPSSRCGWSKAKRGPGEGLVGGDVEDSARGTR
jgi:hypothetical protein